MNGQVLVAEQLMDFCKSEKVDIVLAQDPPLAGSKIPFIENCRIVATAVPGAAMIVINDKLKILTLSKFCNKYVSAANVSWSGSQESMQIVSAYFKYSLLTVEFVGDLRKIPQKR